MKIGIGTVQWGLPYGISNTQGQTSPEEAARILEAAQKAGVQVLDTAPSYGTSEQVLGEALPRNHSFRIITKTPAFKTGTITAHEGAVLRETFLRSLDNLRQTGADSLLIHHADDLLVPGGEQLVQEMKSLVLQKRVKKIGVSVYTAHQIDRVLELFTPDIIQLPVSVLDQRLIRSGHLSKLKKQGMEIHARSVFLQGLLLMDTGGLDSFFSSIKAHLQKYRDRLKEAGLSPLQAALRFVQGQPEIDVALVGVCSSSEFKEIADALAPAAGRNGDPDFSSFSLEDERMLNPALWKVPK